MEAYIREILNTDKVKNKRKIHSKMTAYWNKLFT